MVGKLHRTADGTAGRFAKWYALAHAAHCGPCRAFLHELEAMLDRLHQAKDVPVDQAALDRLASGPWREAKSETD